MSDDVTYGYYYRNKDEMVWIKSTVFGGNANILDIARIQHYQVQVGAKRTATPLPEVKKFGAKRSVN
jgi:hypothetical protein